MLVYVALAVMPSMTITSPWTGELEIPFAGAGFLGMCPVFATMEEAREWADGKFEIVEFETKE